MSITTLSSEQGHQTRDFLTTWVRNARYVAFVDKIGTAAAKNRIFEEARGRIVLCIDAHVLLAPGSLAQLVRFYETDAHPEDLFQGPMLLDNLTDLATHMEPVWRGEMFGIWGTDLSLVRDTSECGPREIGMHGMGLFSSLKATGWVFIRSLPALAAKKVTSTRNTGGREGRPGYSPFSDGYTGLRGHTPSATLAPDTTRFAIT